MSNHFPHRRQQRLERATVRKRQIGVRVTDAELERIRQIAGVAHLPLATMARAALLGLELSPPVPAINFRTLGELQQQGKNLNQLLIAVHRGRVPQELRGNTLELLRLYHEIRETITRRPAPEAKRG